MRRKQGAAVVAAAGMLCGMSVPASGAVTLAETLGGPQFAIEYGDAGGIVPILDARYATAAGNLAPDTLAGSVAALDFDFSTSGDGTGLFQIEYSLRNVSGSDFGVSRFAIYAINDSTGAFGASTGQATFGPTTDAAEPDGWQLDDDFTGTVVPNFLNLNLADSNSCGAVACDLGMALTWDLDGGVLGPGEIFQVIVALSDEGAALSSRFLDAFEDGNTDNSLRLSGVASVVPVPAALPLMAAGLLGFAGIARRRSAPLR